MLHDGKVTTGNSKSLTAVIVIQKVNPMARGRINPATLSSSHKTQLCQCQNPYLPSQDVKDDNYGHSRYFLIL
jgi:hypothetical protein